MPTFKARKLLFIAALAAPAPAFADNVADEQRRIAELEDEATAEAAARGPVIFAMIENTPYKIEAGKVPVVATMAEYGRFVGATQPLTGPNGRPACGNVVSKSSAVPKCEIARNDALTARAEAIAAKVAKATAAAKAAKGKTRR